MIISVTRVLVLLLAAMTFALFLGTATTYAYQEISTYDIHIDLAADSSFVVSETIVYDFNLEERHGIFRNIPTTHPQEGSSFLTERYIDIEVLKVQMDDGEVPFLIEEKKNEVSIRIGDSNTNITGEHTYVIEYRVRGGLTYPVDESFAELYWNAIGGEWTVPILRARVTTSAPPKTFLREKSCYIGSSIEDDRSCLVTTDDDDEILFTATTILSGDSVTIARAIDLRSVQQIKLERIKINSMLIGLLIAWIFALIYWALGYKNQYRVYRPVVAQYEPYKDFKPMLAGVLIDGQLQPQDITAGILYLAQQGYIKIRATKQKILFFSIDDHEVELLKPLTEIEGKFDRWLMELMFSSSDPIGKKVSLNELRKNTNKQLENHRTIRAIKRTAVEELADEGYYEVYSKEKIRNGWLLIGFGAVIFGVGVALEHVTVMILSLFPVVGAGVWLLLYRRSTRKGFEAKNHLEGFEEYLSVTGEERFAFHNAPDKNPEEFMKHLPYAVAFGVEDEWAKVFEDVTIPSPSWYEGSSSTFSATSLADGLGSFSTALSSASGSSSASSGGGSAGGGAGGGGGGSW